MRPKMIVRFSRVNSDRAARPWRDQQMKKQSAIGSDPLFQKLLQTAKQLRAQSGISVLMSSGILAGFAVALAARSATYPELAQRLPAIRSAISQRACPYQPRVLPPSDGKMPVSDDLRKLIASKGDSLESLVGALIEAVSAASTISGPEYADILAYAAAAAAKTRSPVITPELFAGAAWIAFVQGRFSTNQALSSFFMANRHACEVLATEAGLEDSLQPEIDQPLAPLSDAVLWAVGIAGFDGERLLSALDSGLKFGQQILSEAATAYHEAGHAVVSSVLRPSLPVTKVTIAKDGNAAGTTFFDSSSPYWDQSKTREMLVAELATALAGRSAEVLKFGFQQIDAGASGDIEGATTTAWRGIASSGFDPELGPINLETIAKLQGRASGWIFDLAQRKVHEILLEGQNRAQEILRANWQQVEALVANLLKKKTLTEAGNRRQPSRDRAFWGSGGAQGDEPPDPQEGRVRPIAGRIANAGGAGAIRYGRCASYRRQRRSWPAPRSYFDRTYSREAAGETHADGVYVKRAREVLAVELTAERRLDLTRGRGLLQGKAGDWVVDYGDGELSIVSQEQFAELYDLAPAESKTSG